LSDKQIGAPAVLFDIDGTLVDSNYLHTHAWQRAFAAVGIDVEAWRIHRSIGMDGSTLVKSLSDNAPDHVQTRLKDLHSRYYKETAPLLRPLPGARELLARVAALRLKVVFATSAPKDELSLLREVIDSDGIVAEVTSDADVDTAKPEPDIIHVALDRAGVSANRAVFVGDAIWDAQACARAHVTFLGVLSGGISRAELENASAAMVFTNTDHLLADLGKTPIAQLATVGSC
jgi:HAD superfamily hydrolase (TIGR01509 family)